MVTTFTHNGAIEPTEAKRYTSKEAADHLGIGTQAIYAARTKGRITAEMDNGTLYFSQETLDAYRASMMPVLPTEKTEPQQVAIPAITHTFTLKSGGTLTFTYAINLFHADTAERALLTTIIDAVRTYEQGIK